VNYFRLQGTHAFYVPREKLLHREHPVGWLRVRSLVHRAEKLGYDAVAARMAAQWRDAARHLGIAEDYEGTWSDELFGPLQEMLDNMLEETAPRAATSVEAGTKSLAEAQSVVGILNAAWIRFESDATAFVAEETAAISHLESGAVR
jgi:hypothetical protein